jgi:hypothetical protein
MTDERVRKQYESLYGPYAPGDYVIGDQVRYRGGKGEIIWSCHNAAGKFVYVVDSGGWPVEITANEIVQSRD